MICPMLSGGFFSHTTINWSEVSKIDDFVYFLKAKIMCAKVLLSFLSGGSYYNLKLIIWIKNNAVTLNCAPKIACDVLLAGASFLFLTFVLLPLVTPGGHVLLHSLSLHGVHLLC